MKKLIFLIFPAILMTNTAVAQTCYNSESGTWDMACLANLQADLKPQIWVESGVQNNYACPGIGGALKVRTTRWDFDTNIVITINGSASVSTPSFQGGRSVTVPQGTKCMKVHYVSGPDNGSATVTINTDPTNRFEVVGSPAYIHVTGSSCPASSPVVAPDPATSSC